MKPGEFVGADGQVQAHIDTLLDYATAFDQPTEYRESALQAAQAILAHIADLHEENERLRDVVDAALLMRSACPMDWTHGDCRDSQCAVVCCALSALDEEATDA